MRIQHIDGTDFILPTNFAAEFKRCNGLLTDIGDQTTPLTLPADSDGVNLKLIGYSDRIDSAYKSITDLPVIVTDGVLIRRCNMGIHSADEEDGISCTFYFSSGNFFSQIGEKKLAELPWIQIKHPDYANKTLTERVKYLIDLLKNQYNTNESSCNFHVFPVATSQTFIWYDSELAETTYEGLLILNGFYKGDDSTLIFDSSHTITLTVLQGEYTQKIKSDSSDIHLTTGYGMTPFLKLKYVVDFVFSYFGYKVELADLEALFTNFDDIVILNNVADAIYSGILEYSQLVPDMTIKNFISEIEKIFAGKFVVDDVRMSAKFCTYDKYLNLPADIDLSAFLTAKPKKGEAEFKNIVIVDTNDSTIDTDATSEDDEKIEFASPKTSTITYPLTIMKSATTTLYVPFVLKFTCLTLSDIVHKNSAFEVGGKIVKETGSALSGLVTAFNNPGYNSDTLKQNSITYTVLFRQGYKLFDGTHTPAQILDSYYTAYKEFRANSNIPVSAKMNIVEWILNSMDISVPKLVNGQRLMIEEIICALGNTDQKTQTVNFRTLRSYQNRD